MFKVIINFVLFFSFVSALSISTNVQAGGGGDVLSVTQQNTVSAIEGGSIINSFKFSVKWSCPLLNTVDYTLDVLNPVNATLPPIATMTIPKEALNIVNGKLTFEMRLPTNFFGVPTNGYEEYNCRLKVKNWIGNGTNFTAYTSSIEPTGGASLYVLAENLDVIFPNSSTTTYVTKATTFRASGLTASVSVNAQFSTFVSSTSTGTVTLHPISYPNAKLAITPTLTTIDGNTILKLTVNKQFATTITPATWEVTVTLSSSGQTVATYRYQINKTGGTGNKLNLSTLNNQYPPQLTCLPTAFDQSTEINFEQPTDAAVTLQVFSTTGQLVSTLVNTPNQAAGTYNYTLDAANLPKGIYLVHLQSGNETLTKRVVKL